MSELSEEPMVHAVIYRGPAIVATVHGPRSSVALNVKAGEQALEVFEAVDPALYYVDQGKVRQRRPMPIPQITPGVRRGERAQVGGLPPGVRVEWPDGVVTTEPEGAFSFTGNIAGAYRFAFSHPTYLPREVVIDVA